MPPKSISTWNGNTLNSASYRSTLVNAGSTPGADIVFIGQPQADSVLSGAYTVGERDVELHIRILNPASRKALREQLMVWFKRGVRGLLVGLFDDSYDYQLDCQVESLEESTDDPMVFIAHLKSGQTAWRSVLPTTDTTWSPTGTSSTHTITVGGTDETMLSITLTSVTPPVGVYLYQDVVELVNTPALAHGWKACCIVVDTAALVTAGKLRSDCADLRIKDAGVEIARWMSDPNTNHTHVWFMAYMGAGYTLTLNPGTTQIETAVAVGTITGSGDAAVLVTASGMTGSPKTINVAVTNGDSADTWAGKVRTALAADVDVTALFAVSGTTNRIILTRLAAALNDSSLNISLTNGTCTGITPDTVSNNTRAGSIFSVPSSGDISTLEFLVSAETRAALTALPATFTIRHGTEWISCQKTSTSITRCKVTVLKREAMGTTSQAHVGGDVFYYIEHSLVLYYGNQAATDPAVGNPTYNNRKPVWDLSASDMTQSTWTASTLFYDPVLPSRPGCWSQFVSRLGPNSKLYTVKGDAASGDPALGIKASAYLQGSWKSDTVTIGWKFASPGCIRRITCTGRKYRSGGQWPAVAELQCSPNGSNAWTTVFSEATPGSAGAFANWSVHTNVDIPDTSKALRLILQGLSGSIANSYQLLEGLTFITYWTTANIPSLTRLGEQSNHHLEIELNNQATAGVRSVDDSLYLDYPIKIGKAIAMDGEANTVTYEGVNAHGAMDLDDESRTVLVRLLPGTNNLTLRSKTGLSMGTLSAALSWYKRRL